MSDLENNRERAFSRTHRTTSALAGFTLVELLVVIAIIGVLIALLLPAVQSAREAGRRSQCLNNLRQVGLAMQTYHDSKRALPKGAALGCCYGTWAMQVLPFLEQQNLAIQYKNLGGVGGSLDYWHGENLANVTSKRIEALTCPSDVPRVNDNGVPIPLTLHNYAGNHGATGTDIGSSIPVADREGVLYQGSPFTANDARSYREIEDGLSNTVLMAEVVQGTENDLRGLIWWAPGAFFHTFIGPNSNLPDITYPTNPQCNPTDPNPPCAKGSDRGVFASRSRHPDCVQIALCDGSSRVVSDSIDITTWRNLGSTQDGQAVSSY